MKALLDFWITRLAALLRGLGPYAAIELLLPGGSAIALLIWLCRHRATVATMMRLCSSRGIDSIAKTASERPRGALEVALRDSKTEIAFVQI